MSQDRPTGPDSASPPLLIGHGYDLHRLEPRTDAAGEVVSGVRPLVLGGVRLEHDLGPVAHSDGDALYHAVTDAVLGALAEPDIGQLFPDTDPRHDAEDSAVYLEEAVRRAARHGYAVQNLDATVILERPKLSPHKDRMRRKIADLLGLPIERVNVKGKTHEGVDALGEGRAVEVHAVVLLAKRS